MIVCYPISLLSAKAPIDHTQAEEKWDSSLDDEDEMRGRIATTPKRENLANLFPFTSIKTRPSTLPLLLSFLPVPA
jgi:hypothetical protein